MLKTKHILKKSQLQYISDLHLETLHKYHPQRPPKIPVHAPYLAILGDLGNPLLKNYFRLLQYTNQKFDGVFIIGGNHEYGYNNEMLHVEKTIYNMTKQLERVHYLNNSCYRLIDKERNINHIILGSTLWSKISSKHGNKQQINGLTFNGKPVTNEVLNRLHERDRKWLEHHLLYFRKNYHLSKQKTNAFSIEKDFITSPFPEILVLTHHLPSYSLIPEYYLNHPYWSQRLDFFASDLDHLILPPISHWLCGHSHTTLSHHVNGIPVHINALGKPYLTPQVKTIQLSPD